MKVTLSMFKADVGSKGGHTEPSEKMVSHARQQVLAAQKKGLIIDGYYSYTGDDNFSLYSHNLGPDDSDLHGHARTTLEGMTEIAREEGLYGAGQDIDPNSSSRNVRGSGIACGEYTFEVDFGSKNRPAEAFLVFQADKCGPGIFNKPWFEIFCNSEKNPGLLIKPELTVGFTFEIIDMDYKGSAHDRMIRLHSPEDSWRIHTLLQNTNRFAIKRIWSRFDSTQVVGGCSAERLHNVFGKYTGKDDPFGLLRTQGIFPPPEACVTPFKEAHLVEGGMMGSLVRSLMPVALNTPVTGAECQPLIACYAASMDSQGRFSHTIIDIFGTSMWEGARKKALLKSQMMEDQGGFSVGMASQTELAYTGMAKTMEALEGRFELVPIPGKQEA